MLAVDYPLLNVFFSIFAFFLFFAWVMVLFHVIGDIFRSNDLGGGGKAAWALFVLFVPWLGVLVYVFARGGKMQEHAIQQAQAQDQAMRAYVQEAAASPADQLTQLNNLRSQGVLSDADFEKAKAKLLG